MRGALYLVMDIKPLPNNVYVRTSQIEHIKISTLCLSLVSACVCVFARPAEYVLGDNLTFPQEN